MLRAFKSIVQPRSVSRVRWLSTQTAVADGGRPVITELSGSPTAVTVHWSDGESSSFHHSWLLDNNPNWLTSSGQKLPRDIQTSLQPSERNMAQESSTQGVTAEISCDGMELIMGWNGVEGEAVYGSEWLRKFAYSDKVLGLKNEHLKAKNEDKKESIYRSFDGLLGSSKKTYEWLQCINRNGLCVLTGVPQVSETVLSVSSLVGPASHTIYGNTFDVKETDKPINIAYSNSGLEYHMDLAYYESPPGLQFLHVIQFDESVQGGESIFIDAHAVAEELQERDPEAFDVLCRVPATFVKDHTDRDLPVQMWYQRPHISVNTHNQVTSVFWSPPFEGPLQVNFEDVDVYYSAYSKFKSLLNSNEMEKKYGFSFRMNPGELVTFNNRRMLHGRTAFTSHSGTRHLQGTYVSSDCFLNKLRVLDLQFNTSDISSEVGTSYWSKDEKRFGISCHH